MEEYGTNSWKLIANQLPGLTTDQCKRHWFDVLDPSINDEPWTEEEDFILIEVQYSFYIIIIYSYNKLCSNLCFNIQYSLV